VGSGSAPILRVTAERWPTWAPDLGDAGLRLTTVRMAKQPSLAR
jgi:hypothetical protein